MNRPMLVMLLTRPRFSQYDKHCPSAEGCDAFRAGYQKLQRTHYSATVRDGRLLLIASLDSNADEASFHYV